MGLLKHPKSNSYHNASLDHPAKINIEHKITPDNLNISHKKNDNRKPSLKHQVSFPINIRVDNHVRNDVTALIQLGFAKTNKELVANLVQNKISTLTNEQNRRFKALKRILEQKDVLNYEVKHGPK